MALAAGDKLGPYEILSLIGKGGMGEVYRAQDTRLNRHVAIKISADQFSERFDREARAVAALNHPHICQIYDVGPNYIVMELVEGEAPKGPLPLDTALLYARQIVEALEAAHEKNIVHRDLKPANIKITPSGDVKVLDFGLAKMDNASATQSENSPTLSMAATRAGVILGTAGYMSPEQARGKRVDKRADIWAFGVVLYELLMGKRLFHGEDATETLAKVIQAEPKLDEAPPQVRRLLKSCLEKDPAKRLRDIGDVWRLLDESPTSVPLRSRFSWGVAAILAIIAAVGFWAPWRSEKPADRPLVRLDVDLGTDVSLPPPINWFNSTVVISPDGTRIAYLAIGPGGQQRLLTRRLDQTKATELPGTGGAMNPIFSPDGQWIGFNANGKFNKISVEGGAVVPLTDMATAGGASWGEDGTIVVGGPVGQGLIRFPASGGPSVKATDPAKGEFALAWAQILPGGKAVLFAAYDAADINKAHIDVITIADQHRKTLVPGGTSSHYLPANAHAGYLLYNNKSTLFAIAFDLDRLETRGTAFPILDDLAYQTLSGGAQYDVSSSGTLVYRKSSGGAAGGAMVSLQWLDSSGKKEPMRAKPGVYQNLHLSPDGRRVSMVVPEGGSNDVWVYDTQRDATQRLTFGGQSYVDPIWSPDGRYVIVGSVFGGLFWTRSDGASQPQSLTSTNAFQVPWSFTPDGKRLAYFEISGPPQIWTVAIEQNNDQVKAAKPEQFLKSQFQDFAPSFSPDGKWVAYTSTATGMNEVYVRAYPPPSSGQAGQWQISNSGGVSPRWTSHDLLYQSGDQIMAVGWSVKDGTFVAEKPRVWLAKLGGATTWDLAPDGKRIAALLPVDTPEAPKQEHEVVFLQNFPDELRRRVPLSK